MAGTKSIGNPLGAYGSPVEASTTEEECVVGTGGVARGDLVRITHDAVTGRLVATRSATADATTGRFGVAEQVGAAGAVARVTTRGFTYVNGGGNVFAAGEAIFRSGATVGIADRVVPDATTISGTMAGTVLGVKGSAAPYPFTNAVPVYIDKF